MYLRDTIAISPRPFLGDSHGVGGSLNCKPPVQLSKPDAKHRFPHRRRFGRFSPII